MGTPNRTENPKNATRRRRRLILPRSLCGEPVEGRHFKGELGGVMKYIIAVTVIGLALLAGVIWAMVILKRCMNIMRDLEGGK